MTAYTDIHVHPPVAQLLEGPLAPFVDGLVAATGRSIEVVDGGDVIEYYRSRNARAMFVGWDLETSGNRRPFSSADVAALVVEAPDVVAGWGAVDAAKGALAVAQVHEAARLGMKGIAVHPAAQGMGPGDRLSSPVWEAAAEYGLVCLVHTGTTRLGYGSAGGAGVKLTAGDPLHVDSVAAKLPHLRFVLAHTGPLWAEEAIAVASHKANVYLSRRERRHKRGRRLVWPQRRRCATASFSEAAIRWAIPTPWSRRGVRAQLPTRRSSVSWCTTPRRCSTGRRGRGCEPRGLAEWVDCLGGPNAALSLERSDVTSNRIRRSTHGVSRAASACRITHRAHRPRGCRRHRGGSRRSGRCL